MINEVVIVGKIAKTPIIKEVSSGAKLSTIIVEVEKAFKNGVGVVESDFVTVVLWRGIAEAVVDITEIGSMIGVKGRLQTRTFESSDNKRITTMEIVAERVTFLDKYLTKHVQL